MFGVSCVLLVACCLLSVVRCLLCVVCCLLFPVCCHCFVFFFFELGWLGAFCGSQGGAEVVRRMVHTHWWGWGRGVDDRWVGRCPPWRADSPLVVCVVYRCTYESFKTSQDHYGDASGQQVETTIAIRYR